MLRPEGRCSRVGAATVGETIVDMSLLRVEIVLPLVYLRIEFSCFPRDIFLLPSSYTPMRRISFFVSALAVFLALPHVSHAQTQTLQQKLQKGQLTLHAGAFFPQGEFGSTDQDDENSGFATTGFTVVGEYTYPAGNTPGLGLIGTISFSANSIDEDELFGDSDPDEVDGGSWINVPIMVGTKYEAGFSPAVDLYGLGQVGINVSSGPTIEAEFGETGTITETQTLGGATSFGFTVGAGAVINDQINVGLRYQGLGEPEISNEVEVDGDTRVDDDYDQPLSGIQLLVGIDL